MWISFLLIINGFHCGNDQFSIFKNLETFHKSLDFWVFCLKFGDLVSLAHLPSWLSTAISFRWKCVSWAPSHLPNESHSVCCIFLTFFCSFFPSFFSTYLAQRPELTNPTFCEAYKAILGMNHWRSTNAGVIAILAAYLRVEYDSRKRNSKVSGRKRRPISIKAPRPLEQLQMKKENDMLLNRDEVINFPCLI